MKLIDDEAEGFEGDTEELLEFFKQVIGMQLGKDESISLWGKLVYDVNNLLLRSFGFTVEDEWEELSGEMRDGIEDMVRLLVARPMTTLAEIHSRWVYMQMVDGWKYGEEFSLKGKTSPNLLPYSELPIFRQVRDKVIETIVREFIHYSQGVEFDE